MNKRIPFILTLLFITFVCFNFMFSCKGKKVEPPKPNPYEKSEIEIKVFSNASTADSALGGFGYDIYLQKSLYVHQPHIPAVNGNRGFSSAEAAEKTGTLTAYKIRNNIMPPSLTVEELDSIGVLK